AVNRFGGAEDVEVLLLVFRHQVYGFLNRGGGADDGGEPGGRAVHELDAAFAHDDVIRGAHPDLGVAFVVDFLTAAVKIGGFHVADSLKDFFSEQGGQTGIQAGSQIGQVVLFGRNGRQQGLAALHDFHGVFQFGNGNAHQGVDDGQIVSGIGETDLLVLPVFLQSLIQLGRAFSYDFMCPADGSGKNDFRHVGFLLP